MLTSLGFYNDSATQRAILATLRHCIKSQEFLKEFTAGLVKQESSKPAPGSAGVLLRWSSLVLQHLDVTTAQKAASKVIECQATWLSTLAATGQRRGPAQQSVSTALAAKPELLDLYVSVATAKASAPLVRAIWGYAAKKKDLQASVSASLLQIFVDSMLSAKERPSQTALSCFSHLLKAATAEQVTGILIPAALRMIRRSPEAALASSIFMLGAISHDLSAAAPTEIMPVLVQQARHAKEPVLRLSVEATVALAGKIGDPSALQECVKVVSKTLDGSDGGKIKNVQERASLAAVLEALASAPGRGAGISTAATAAVEFVCSFFKEEITEEGKLALLRALGAWLPRCAQMPPAALTRISDGLKDKETLRRGHLRALVRALSSNVELRANAAELAPGLAKLIQEGATKVATRLDGLLALLAAAYIAGADASADTAFDKAGAWTAGLSELSPLLASATASKLAPEDAAVHAELCGAVLTLHTQRLGGESGPTAVAAARTLVLLLFHYSPAVRTAAGKAAAEVASSGPAHVMTILDALKYWLSSSTNDGSTSSAQGTAVGVLQDPAEGEVSMSLEAVHERHLHALLSCLPHKSSGEIPSSQIVATVLLLAFHPMIAAARRSSADGAWLSVSRHLEGAATVIKDSPEAVVAGLMEGVNSTDPAAQTSAYGALAAAAGVAAPQLFRPVLDALAPLLDRTAHDELSARQLRIYATSRGRTSNENEDGSIIPVELFEEMLADKSSIKPPIFPPSAVDPLEATAEEKKPAGAAKAAVRPSVAAAQAARGGKPTKAPVKDAAAEARARQLKNESEIRAGVVAIRETLARGLTALGAFSGGDCAFSAAHLEELAAPALPLLTSPLVSSIAAFGCVRQLAGCIPGAPGWRALDIAAALRLVAALDAAEHPAGKDYQHLADQRCVESSIYALLVATGGHPAVDGEPVVAGHKPLPGPVYNFCFPILRAVLR